MANYLATDTDLTAVADAIRQKGGTSAQMAFPAGFVSAVQAIPTGGGGTPGDYQEATRLMTQFSFASISGYTYPQTVKVDASNATKLDGMFYALQAWDERTPYYIEMVSPTSTSFTAPDCFRALRYGLRKVTITGQFKPGNNVRYMFADDYALTEIDGVLDFSNQNAWSLTDCFRACQALETITFVESCIKDNISFLQSSVLSEASLISIANALNAGVTGKTLSLHATPKASLASIMGTVSDGVFTKDASGSVSLSDFITSTKGWTLA